MANEKHLKMLQKGVEAWNRWKAKHRDIKSDLAGADLSGASLRHADLIEANLCGANLGGANLGGACLASADLRDADLGDANLRGADLVGADLRHADLVVADLDGAGLSGASLAGASLAGASLGSAFLHNANLSRANLHDAYLAGADLIEADLRGADLGDAFLNYTNLHDANLSDADLCGASLSGANLSRARLSGSRFDKVLLGSTVFGANDLSEAKNLETARHLGPSTIGVDTLYASKGRIPESFLRDAGVPDEFIEYNRALFRDEKAIQFSSCFISYSTKDEEFARRLHSRLRDEHVRVWFAPEDLAGGKKLHEQIADAIRVMDKLLLVLSDHSIHSEWVKDEIRKARKREIEEKRRKLFPIRLASFETFQDWECRDSRSGQDLAEEVRQYFIPDFSNWENDSAFDASFKKLLKDLSEK